MKIGVIVPHLKKYGGIRRYLEFGNQLVKKGHDYRLFVIDMSEHYPWVEELGFKGTIIPASDFSSHNLDICICGDAGSLSYLDKSKATLKVVNVIFPLFSSYLLGDYSNYVARDELLVVGNGTNWSGLLDIRPNWRTIPGAVNLNMFKPLKIERTDTRFKILFMAKNRPWKGLDKILEAYEHLKDETNIDWYYFDTEPHTNLPEKFKGLINLPQNQMPELYSQVDVFISMEELAGWQNCAAEAMACGCSVITTQIGAVDFAIDNKTAIIVEDVPGLIKGILTLKKSIKMRQRLVKAGLEVIKNFSWEKYTDMWIDLLESSLAEKSAISYTLDNAKEVHQQVISAAQQVATDLDIINKSAPQEFSEAKSLQAQTDQMSAIMAKANELRRVYSIRQKTSAASFDKYEKYGAYHWNNIQVDKPYADYVELLKKIFKGIADYYGIEEVLDIGGGDGFIAGQLSKLGFPVKLIEINDTAIKLAKMKLKDYPNVKVEHKDFFELTEMPPYALISQVIEHFEDPSIVVSKIRQCKPDIVLISTPIQKELGMWDPDYHVQEFSEDDFIKLFESLIDEYMISHSTLRPFNQILFLERKTKSVERYFRNLIDQTVDEGIYEQILKTLQNIYSLEVKRN